MSISNTLNILNKDSYMENYEYKENNGLLLIDISLKNMIKNIRKNINYILIDNISIDNILIDKIKNMNRTFNFIGFLFLDKTNNILSNENILNEIYNLKNNKKEEDLLYLINLLNNFDPNIEIIEKINNNNYLKYFNINDPIKYKINNIIIFYDEKYISDIPIIENNNENIDNIFSTECNFINLNPVNGQFIIENLPVNLYIFSIIFENIYIKYIIDFTVIIQPKLLSLNNYIIDYSSNISINLCYEPKDGKIIFSDLYLDNIIIDSNIQLITLNNFNVGKYLFPITYYLNNIHIENDLNIIIKPIFYYNYLNKLDIHYISLNNYYSMKPIINPIGGIIKLLNFYNLINVDDNGVLDFSNFNLIGNYEIKIIYLLNEIKSEFLYKISNISNILSNYISNEMSFEYSNPIKIKLNYDNFIENKIFLNKINNFIIDNNFDLINTDILEIGVYNIIIKYLINNIFSEYNIKINIIPKLIYLNYDIIISNSENYYSELPNISPIVENFKLYSNNTNININDNGQIIINPINTYKINNFIIFYEINNISIFKKFKLFISPYFNYNILSNSIQIPYGINYISNKPNINRLDGIFSCNFDYININKLTGIFIISNKLNYGKYNFNIKYNINEKIFYESEFYLTIKPIITYTESEIYIIYGKYYELSNDFDLSTINSKNNKYNFHLINLINGVTIDSKTGKLYFNKDSLLNIGKYIINVMYQYSNDLLESDNSITILHLIIIPDFFYDCNINLINFNNNFISNKPCCKPDNGTFKLITNNNCINIDTNGIIFANSLDIGQYNFKIQYNINDIFSEINYSIICNPILIYEKNKIELLYNNEYYSEIPLVSPSGGTFKLKNSTIGIEINSYGQLHFNSSILVGYYNIIIIYQINTNIITTNYSVVIKPEIIYNNDIYTYNSFIKTDKPYVSHLNGKFKLLENNILYNDNILCDQNDGILNLTNFEPSKYKINIEYIVNNVSIQTIYSFLILPKIILPNSNIIYKFKEKKEIIPIFKPKNGLIKIILNDELLKNITTENLEIGDHIFNIEYIYNNINTICNLNVRIESNIYYENENIFYDKNYIIYPKNYEISENNYFYCKNIIISQNGGVNTSKLEVGKYNYNIEYHSNNIITNVNLVFSIIPEFYYLFDKLNIIYNISDFIIDRPFTSFYDETKSKFYFQEEYDYLNIDNITGKIIIDKKLLVGNYNIIIIYEINDIKTFFNFDINIDPNISYENYDLNFNYGDSIIINKPLIEPLIFDLEKKNISCLNLPKNLILNEDGSLKSINNIDVGDYLLNIEYIINLKLKTYNIIKSIRLIIHPNFYYKNNCIFNIFNTPFKSDIPSASNKYGIYSLDDNYNNILVNNQTGQIFINNLLNIGIYNLKVNYELNNVIITQNYIINIIPYINSDNIIFEFIYNQNNIIPPPNVKPYGGCFKLLNNHNKLKLNNDGSININDLLPDEYDIKLYYIFNNNLLNSITYNIKIKPYLNYNSHNLIIYNSDYKSNIPLMNPPNGKIISSKINLFKDNGQFLFNNFNVGKHNLDIYYNFNNQINKTNIEFEIIPKVIYKNYNYIMVFGDIIYSEIPILDPYGLIFSCNNYSISFEKNGVIKFYNIDVGYHNIKINYGTNYSFYINLTVKPNFNYELKDICKFYGDELIIKPNIININGKFKCSDEDILINDIDGAINLSLIYPCDKKFIIFYELNSVTNKQKIKIKCYPKISYIISKTIIEYLKKSYSVIPNCDPPLYSNNIKNGNIICNNLIDGIEIKNNGIIKFINPNIGNYNLEIIYIYNSISTKINYKLFVEPVFYYNKFETINSNIFYFGFNNKSNKPIINPIGGTFFSKYKLNNNGEIILNSKFEVGTYSIKVYYKIIKDNKEIIAETNYNFTIIPFIYYKNITLFFNSNEKIIPYINPLGGVFSSDNNIYIDDDGSFNIYNLEPNKYKINIIYEYKNIKYQANCNLLIKPEIKLNNYNLVLIPDIINPELFYDSNIININNNIITFNKLLKLGKYKTSIIYKYNNISSKLILTFIINYNKLYENIFIDLLSTDSKIIYPLINYGIFKSNKFKYIYIDSSGIIFINNADVGIYILNINYKYLNFVTSEKIQINIKPKILQNNYDITYGNNNILLKGIPENGIFNFSNLPQNIKCNNNGLIKISKIIPNKYIIDYKYTFNNSIDNGFIYLNIIPNIIFDSDKIICKYNDGYINNSLNAFPDGGNFYCCTPNIILNFYNFEINKNISVGKYDINIIYTINNQSNNKNIKLVIEPKFYYPINEIKINYFDSFNYIPFINPINGTFSKNININGLFLNHDTGIISGNNIDIGKYNLIINYTFNNIISNFYFTIISEPIFYYDKFININYSENYTIKSDKPKYYPLNGKFKTDNPSISIDENTGIITFSNLEINNYSFNIYYRINNIKLSNIFNLIVKPIIYYNNSIITIYYNNTFISDIPYVNKKNGIFICNNLPNGFYLNKDTGIIKLYKLNETIKNGKNNIIIDNIPEKGKYTLDINYIYNYITVTTNLFIIII